VKKALFPVIFLLFGTIINLPAQDTEPADSLVRLLSAQSVRMVQKEGENFREVVGPASFLHNNTFLLCDTAVWNVDTKIIHAAGHVQIIQNETTLTSEKLDYITDLNVAQFRGGVVQLMDKDHNTLRTTCLDYNTKDSVAVFERGGSMKDKDGQVIESIKGTYDSKIKTFSFEDEVNMYADSIYVQTALLKYHSDIDRADFLNGVDAWKEDNMLSSVSGWYDKAREVFFFNDNVHFLTRTQEGWADSLYVYRRNNSIIMQGDAQITDTTRNVSALADKIHYQDSLSLVTMTGEAAVVAQIRERRDSVEKVDTLYLGSKRITLQSLKMFQVSDADTAAAATRRNEIFVDPVAQYRAKAAEAAAAEREKALEEKRKREGQLMPAPDKPKVDSLSVPAPSDSLAITAPADSLAAPSDSLAVPITPDSTIVRFIEAYGDVKLFKNNIQARCDSLVYNDLDSLVRMYLSPSMWNEKNRQYVADSIFILVKGATLDRANLLSNAFIMIQEDEDNFDQVRSTEMMAYFDSTSALKRFDALGEAHAVFHLKEDDKVTTTNKVETRMLTTQFVNGQLDRVYYYDSPKNDAYPTIQLPQEFRRMKGFSWDPDRRPASGADVTSHSIRSSQRSSYTEKPVAKYIQTERFFPGYMQSVADSIAARKSREKALAERRMVEKDSLAAVSAEAVIDSTGAASDTLSVTAMADSTTVAADSLCVVADTVAVAQLSAREQKALERKAKRGARIAELDRRDAEKAAAKAEKDRQRRHKKAKKFLEKRDKQAAKEEAKIQSYMRRYEKRYQKRSNK